MTRIVLAGLAAGIVGACTPGGDAPQSPRTGLANPASVYCLEQGGELVPVDTPAGVSNDCVLPNGETIDEWTLYRRDHSG
ncbi:putative hemolysin [Amorphus orientalis]|nr:DUF333 domain-containing protein [Amorphus orientalis]